jgi:hypothetical protein
MWAKITTILLFLALAASPALAVGPVLRQCTLEWNPVTTNTDGSPATDLKEYRIYVSTTPGGQNLASPQGPPILAPTTITSCTAQGITSDGQKYVVVTAADLAGNQSAPSNEVPFVLDAVAPAAASNLRVR